MGPVTRSARRVVGLIAVAVAFGLFPAAALGVTPSVDIHSAGPLSDIYIGNDLSCQVRSGGFSSTEFFPNASGPGDCGTFLFISGGPPGKTLLGPDFANHAGGTHTTDHFPVTEVPFTPVSQLMTGSGTSSSPFRVTTVTSGVDGSLTLTFTEVDTYVVGNNFFQTDITVSNASADARFIGELYHAADCQLRGSDSGFGAPEPPAAPAPNTGACTVTSLNSPASALEEFVPITSLNTWVETSSPTIWNVLDAQALGSTCDCGTFENNAIGIEWPISALAAGHSQTLSFKTQIVDTVPSGGFSFAGPAGSTVGGTVATISDPNASAAPSAYSATINWGDGTTSPGTITGGNGSFDVTGKHAYSAGGSYPVAVTITSVGTNQGSSTVQDSATMTAPPPPGAPSPVVTGAPTIGITGAGFTGSVNPSGLPTTAFFQYGLDPKYTGGGPVVYTQSTPVQAVGSDFTTHTVTASVSGLAPNATYHVRLVATNSAGTSFGPDVTFATLKAPPPSSPPAVGKTFDISPVSGVVLILVHGQLVPLTELSQIPQNALIDALHGTLTLTTALPGGSGGAHDAAAHGKKHKPKVKTQTGTFGGAIFRITQARNGLATLAMVEGAIPGGPSFSQCRAHKAAEPVAAAASSRTLQLLHASAKGKFRTRGRYGAATVRGTKWTIADRCDGTLTHDITDSVVVNDFVRHRTIILHAGQSYLARARVTK
ncbi:MAG: hypothetical protein JO304_05080 [Solirubrobacterales bacterium]|nr:hypothetical protein [Solirubrobacterales bacterium]